MRGPSRVAVCAQATSRGTTTPTPTATLERAPGTRPLPTAASETRAADPGTKTGANARRLNLKPPGQKQDGPSQMRFCLSQPDHTPHGPGGKGSPCRRGREAAVPAGHGHLPLPQVLLESPAGGLAGPAWGVCRSGGPMRSRWRAGSQQREGGGQGGAGPSPRPRLAASSATHLAPLVATRRK